MLQQLQNNFIGKFHTSSRLHHSDRTVKVIYKLVTSNMDITLPIDSFCVICGRK